MKEVKFRWIDQYLIHMTLKTKFAILALVPMIMIVGLAVFLISSFSKPLLIHISRHCKTQHNKLIR